MAHLTRCQCPPLLPVWALTVFIAFFMAIAVNGNQIPNDGADLDSWLSGWTKKAQPKPQTDPASTSLLACPPVQGLPGRSANSADIQQATQIGQPFHTDIPSLRGKDHIKTKKTSMDDKKRSAPQAADPLQDTSKRAKKLLERTPEQIAKSTRILEEHLGLAPGVARPQTEP
jgi:hypothetical protein